MVKGFSKIYNLLFFGQFFFCKQFYFITGFCKKNSVFANSKSRAQELSNDVSFVIFGHQIWDLGGGDQIAPPPAYPGFQVPQHE